MTGMELYVKFLFSVTAGVAGIGLVLTTVFSTVLYAWDPTIDLRRWWRRMMHARSHADAVRADDILVVLGARDEGRYEPRLDIRTIDRRREALREVREAETRLSKPVESV